MITYLEQKLGIKSGETTSDGEFTIQQAECLGACDAAPMLQVTNSRYVMQLTPEKIDAMLDALREGKLLDFESVTLPQDTDQMGGNRRSDTQTVLESKVAPIAETIR